MMNNKLNNYKKSIDDLKNAIETYPLEITQGTKKVIAQYKKDATESRNAIVKELIEKYNTDIELLKKHLEARKTKVMPIQNEELTKDIDLKLKSFKDFYKYTNTINDYYDKLGLNKIVTNLTEDGTNLAGINIALKKVIYIFQEAGIELTNKDFNYSIYTKLYMTKFLENRSSTNLETIIKEFFDIVYWQCPSILIHLKQNIRFLTIKYKKKLEQFCDKKKNEVLLHTNLKDKNYAQLHIEYYNKKNARIAQNPFNLVNRFLNKQLVINDFKLDNPQREQRIDKFIKNGKFDAFDEEEKEKFYLECLNIKYMLSEIEKYHTFEPLIKDVITKYEAKTKVDLKSKLKEISKNEKLKNKKLKQFLKIKDNSKKETKTNILNKEINDQIIKIDGLYTELDDLKIIDVINKNINPSSTIMDAILILDSFYDYLKKQIIKAYNLVDLPTIESHIERFNQLAYENPNHTIMMNINLFENNKLEEILYNKCQLFDINISLEDVKTNISSLKNDIDFVIDNYNIGESSISLEEINVICELNK